METEPIIQWQARLNQRRCRALRFQSLMIFLFIFAIMGILPFYLVWSSPDSLERTLGLVRVVLFIIFVLVSLGVFGAIAAFFVYFSKIDYEYEINKKGIIIKEALSDEYKETKSRFLAWVKKQEAKQRETTVVYWRQISRIKLHKRHALITIYRWYLVPSYSLACTKENCETVAQVIREQLAVASSDR